MTLLAPLFLAALAAVAVPVLVHLTDRDRRDVVRFPSLKFLRRLPFRQVRRQRIRHPFLFTLRTLAVVLLVLAFTRPLVGGLSAGEGAGDSGREVVIALDVSYSMGYGDTWERAVEAVRGAVDALPGTARVSLLTFADDARATVAATTDHAAVTEALDALRPGSGRTRFAPMLELANEILLDSPNALRQVVLVSDFQAYAWDRTERTQLFSGAKLQAIDLSTADPANAMVAGVELRRSESGEEAAVVVVRLVNQGPSAVRNLGVRVEMNGQEVASGSVTIAASGNETLALGPIEPPAELARLAVRIDGDELAADDAFYLTLSPRPALPVLLVEPDDRQGAGSLFLREALSIAEEPSFDVVVRSVERLRGEDVEAATVILLDECPFPGGSAGRALVEHVGAGAGLWVILGSRSQPESWPEEARALLPGEWRKAVDRLDAGGVSLTSVDYDHPVFEVFSGPDDGNLAGPRFYRYRPIVPGDGARALARYTDGATALAERRFGYGRVLLWGSPLDNRWSDLPIQPVFVPFVHQASRFLGAERAIEPWREAGEVLDLREALAAEGTPQEMVVETPRGRRLRIASDGGEPLLPLKEAGFYEVDAGGAATYPVAVNVDRAESDLTPLDVEVFVAASTVLESTPAAQAIPLRRLAPEERERRQGVWWYLVLAALLLLAAEALWAHRLSRGAWHRRGAVS